MIVKFKHCIAGTGWSRNVDDVTDLPDAEAMRLIKGGIAEAVKAQKPNRKATLPQDEIETPEGN